MSDLQIQASNPDLSIWVSASAGTGKTKILTDRVLRLLIGGSAFDKILCLTFTNAAALEMQSRILAKLEQWANLDEKLLIAEIHLLLQKTPKEQDLYEAKTLYHKLLCTQDKINIHTIHSFCRGVLKQFPFEAGVSPAFQVIDNIGEQEILKKIKDQLYKNEEDKIIDFFTANFHETIIDDILEEVIEHCLKFKILKIPEFVSKPPCPQENFDIDKIINEICSYDYQKELKYYLSNNIEAEIDWSCVRDFFLTKEGQIRKKFSSKIKNEESSLAENLLNLQQKIYKIDQNHKLEQVIYHSQQLKKLGRTFIELYEIYKKQHSLLDYDDLIFLTKSLLTQKDAKEWVLYKLDGGIDHLLVDEAQDTSPEQWSIIEAMITEFYSGEGARTQNRTIFVVGDEKQSIFSFQGADLDSFTMMNDHLKNKLKTANKNFASIDLEWSYRSCEEILDVTYEVFNHIKNIDNNFFAINNPKITPFRNHHPGRVELWPLITTEKDINRFWPLPNEQNKAPSASSKLAISIANFIHNKISKAEILSSTGERAKEGDFMLLFRRRDEFTLEVIYHLKKKGLEVAGIDRLSLNQNLSVADLIACAKFVLLPDDDLNLASLLCSPIVEFTECELQILGSQYGSDLSLWQKLQNNSANYHETLKKLNDLERIYKISNITNFFHIIVDCLNLRQKLNIANGPESDDAINELIYLCQDHAKKKDNSLQGFISWFENNEIEIKRDTSSTNKIKIMTVHGAKGLQSPIVILCDTTGLPMGKSKFMWNEDGDLFFLGSTANIPECLLNLKTKQQKKDLQEYFRLLYVAMTRAEDQLIICGFSNGEKLAENCWYDLVRGAMLKMNCSNIEEILIYENQAKKAAFNTKTCDIINIKSNSNFIGIKDEEIQYQIPELKIDWTIDSPLISQDYLKYGQVFHKILEDSINLKNIDNMENHPLINVLSPGWKNKIHQSIKKLHLNQQFKNILTMEVKTELNIGHDLGQSMDTGRIDLLAMDERKIFIIDYKADSNPVQIYELIPKSYLYQLDFYRRTIKNLYPQHQIICQILWLQTGEFTEVTN